MCGCGKTQNPQGHCDGSHAKPSRKKCACGKTKDPQGYCDGSHAK
jgi:CDGSH-type Zn-finger protein